MSANSLETRHISRLRELLSNSLSLTQLTGWLEKKTRLDGKFFSFVDHEFQKPILEDDALTSIVVKCAQVGISEAMYRWALAACTTQDDFTIIYTFPTTTDAEKFCRTRIDPCINDSPDLAYAVNATLNNAEIKQFGRNSFLYFRGTMSETAALSVPANVVIHDEVDKSNLTQMSVYVSRLQHKPHKLRKMFSTPTVSKYGISKEAETARRMRHVKRCGCCNHTWLPDYFNDIVIPGFDKDKKEITKSNLHTIKWQEARLLCPKCGREPGSTPDLLSWVCENPSQAYPANAWFVTPFSAPNVISAPYLVKVSTEFAKYSEFINQSLGMTAEDSTESITEADVEGCLVPGDFRSSEVHFMGCDMGMLCHITIGRPTSMGEVLVVHREIVHYTQFEERRRELCKEYRVVLSVHDAQPYIDMVDRICNYDPNAYASVFTTGSPGVMYIVKDQEEDTSEGKLRMRRINVTRTAALDNLMNELKAKTFIVQRNEALDDAWKAQLRSLKRVSKFDRQQEIVYVWEKTDGNDHFHFSLLYLNLAIKMRGMVIAGVSASSVPLLTSFRVKQR